MLAVENITKWNPGLILKILQFIQLSSALKGLRCIIIFKLSSNM